MFYSGANIHYFEINRVYCMVMVMGFKPVLDSSSHHTSGVPYCNTRCFIEAISMIFLISYLLLGLYCAILSYKEDKESPIYRTKAQIIYLFMLDTVALPTLVVLQWLQRGYNKLENKIEQIKR